MITYRGFTAWISCNNVPLPEFEVVENEAVHRVTCWIPSIAGQRFSIHWRDEGGGIDTAAYINLDGTVVSGRFLFGHGEASRDGFRTGATTERPFMFMKVDESSEPRLPPKQANETGTIILRIKRIKRTTSKVANRIQPTPVEVASRTREHCIGYGPERDTYEQYSTTWSFEPYDASSPGSYATFVFRYRSAEFLASEGIITSTELPIATLAEAERFTTPTREETEVSPPSTSGESTEAFQYEELPMEYTSRSSRVQSTVPSPSPMASTSPSQTSGAPNNELPSLELNASGPGPDRRHSTSRLGERRVPSYVKDKSKQRKVTYTQRVKYPGEGMLVFKSTVPNNDSSRPSETGAEPSQRSA